MRKLEIDNITDISETLLIPLYARAIESKSNKPIIYDEKAIEITDELNKYFENSKSKLHRNLSKGKLRKRLPASLSLRTRKFDRYTIDFINTNPDSTVVELGCGLSTRYNRIINDNNIEWYDLDLPYVIKIRGIFFEENDNYHLISSSVLDFEWMKKIPKDNKKLLFLAEGLLMYLHEEDVKKLVLKLQYNFHGCHLIAEMANSFIIKTLKRKMWRKKFQRDFYLGNDAIFNFGIKDSRDLESWYEGIEFLNEWTYFDDNEKKLGWINYLGRIEKFRKTQWIIHYILN